MFCRSVDKTICRELAQDTHNTTGAVNVLHVVVSVGCHLAQYGNIAREAVDVGHCEVHTSLVRYGQEVQNGVCRAAHCDVERHSVLEGSLCGNRAGKNRVVTLEVVFFCILHDKLCGLREESLAILVCRNDCSVARQSQADSFVQTVHRVCGKHTRARAATRAGASLNLVGHIVCALLVGAQNHSVDKVGTTTAEVTSLHRATRYKYGGDIKAHRGHQHTRRNLVAVADANQCIYLVRIGHILHAVGDNVARGQRVEHTIMAHSDTVVDGDGVELGCKTTLLLDELFNVLSYLVQMNVTGHHLRKRVGDTDNGHTHLLLLHSVCAPQASCSCHTTTNSRNGAS